MTEQILKLLEQNEELKIQIGIWKKEAENIRYLKLDRNKLRDVVKLYSIHLPKAFYENKIIPILAESEQLDVMLRIK